LLSVERTESKKTQFHVEIKSLYNLSMYHSQSNAGLAQAIISFISAFSAPLAKRAVNAQLILQAPWALVTEGNEREILQQSLDHQATVGWFMVLINCHQKLRDFNYF